MILPVLENLRLGQLHVAGGSTPKLRLWGSWKVGVIMKVILVSLLPINQLKESISMPFQGFTQFLSMDGGS